MQEKLINKHFRLRFVAGQVFEGVAPIWSHVNENEEKVNKLGRCFKNQQNNRAYSPEKQ